MVLIWPYRSGKSSISSVVFHKLPPNETLYLESTARIQKDSLKYAFPLLDLGLPFVLVLTRAKLIYGFSGLGLPWPD